ncbi:MAG: hypothetical protein ACT4OU_09480 [Hyphomicrobium sp.]
MTVRLPDILFKVTRPRSDSKSNSGAHTSQASIAAAPRQSVEQQWSRLSAVLKSAIDGAEDAHRRQAAATQQLDLAQYALHTLGDELAAVMTIPGRREPASVHVLEAPAAPKTGKKKSRARAA